MLYPLFWILPVLCRSDIRLNKCKFSNKKKQLLYCNCLMWELTASNRRPSACKADALNQLS